MAWHLGVDVGGTFTDLALFDTETCSLRVGKELSTPQDPTDGILRGALRVLDHAGVAMSDIGVITHASTIAANTIIEGKGAKVGLVTTAGFRDIVLMGRQARHSTYDIIELQRHVPLLRREHIFEVSERTSAQGDVIEAASDEAILRVAEQIKEHAIESLAIGLINSYRNAQNETALARALAAAGIAIPITISSALDRRIGEFERLSTAVANAYIRPRFVAYLNRLTRELGTLGFSGELHMMQSNSGHASVEYIQDNPVVTVEAGPAGGVICAQGFAREMGVEKTMVLDMGGTTAKACLLDQYDSVPLKPDVEVDLSLMRPGTGIPLRVPSVDVLEIGAGGGSIASVKLGMVQTGPESAGSTPGPSAYGLGGDDATVTDANVVLGYLSPKHFAGGTITLQPELAQAAVARHVASELNMDVVAAAWAIHSAVTLDMELALRAISIERGKDPRDYALVCIGGAAACHASPLARRLGIQQVIIPPYAGVASAIGFIESDRRFHETKQVNIRLGENHSESLVQAIAQMKENLQEHQRTRSGDQRFEFSAQMRFVGQGHLLEVALDEQFDPRKLTEAFRTEYRRTYGSVPTAGDVEVVEIRGSLVVPNEVGVIASISAQMHDESPPPLEVRTLYFPDSIGRVDCQVLPRSLLQPGTELAGPLVIQDEGTTVVLWPGDLVSVDKTGALKITVCQLTTNND